MYGEIERSTYSGFGFLEELSIVFRPNSRHQRSCTSNETLEGIDEDGDISDWFEIYNNSEESISLDGFSFTDDISEPYKWVLEHGNRS